MNETMQSLVSFCSGLLGFCFLIQFLLLVTIGPLGPFRWLVAAVQNLLGYKGKPGAELITLTFEQDRDKFNFSGTTESEYWLHHQTLPIIIKVNRFLFFYLFSATTRNTRVEFTSAQAMRLTRMLRGFKPDLTSKDVIRLAKQIVEQGDRS